MRKFILKIVAALLSAAMPASVASAQHFAVVTTPSQTAAQRVLTAINGDLTFSICEFVAGR